MIPISIPAHSRQDSLLVSKCNRNLLLNPDSKKSFRWKDWEICTEYWTTPYTTIENSRNPNSDSDSRIKIADVCSIPDWVVFCVQFFIHRWVNGNIWVATLQNRYVYWFLTLGLHINWCVLDVSQVHQFNAIICWISIAPEIPYAMRIETGDRGRNKS